MTVVELVLVLLWMLVLFVSVGGIGGGSAVVNVWMCVCLSSMRAIEMFVVQRVARRCHLPWHDAWPDASTKLSRR